MNPYAMGDRVMSDSVEVRITGRSALDILNALVNQHSDMLETIRDIQDSVYLLQGMVEDMRRADRKTFKTAAKTPADQPAPLSPEPP